MAKHHQYCRVVRGGERRGQGRHHHCGSIPSLGRSAPQESAPGVAEDKAKVLDLDATVTVPFGTLSHCLKTAEFTPLEPDALENKFYCPGIGIVSELDVSWRYRQHRTGDDHRRLR